MADYYNVTTNTGDAEIAAAIASNTKLAITHIAFGDGNGAVPTPSKTRTTLVREVHRQAVTKYERHPTNANWIVIETIIPSNIGGFWVREMGVIANGKMISHGSHAPFEKVADPTGVSEYRLKFTQNIKDGNVVNITLDQSLIYASQAWTDENYVPRDEIIDNLTTDDATKPVSAKQGKLLQTNKLDKTANAASATKLQTARTVQFSGAATGSFNYDGSSNSSSVLTLVNSGVAANTYGGGLKIPVVTVNAKGLITGVSEQNIPIVDNLTTDDATKPVSAKQAKNLQDNKLGKTENAVSASKLIADDVRLLKPPLLPSGAITARFSCFDLLGNNNQGPFADTITLDTYHDNTGGFKNALAFSKNAQAIRHYQAEYGATEWGIVKTIAYAEDVLSKSGGTLTGPLTVNHPITVYMSDADGAFQKLIQGNTSTDGGYVAVGNHGSDKGYLELGTIDDVDTAIYVRKRRTTDNAIFQEAALLDSEGNTSFPNNVTASAFLGNATTATKLQTARTISLTGAVTGSGSFDGSGNLSIATILQNFTSSKNVNGYKYLGDGLIIQWGLSSTISDETIQAITFPIAFPSSCLNIQLTENKLSTSQAAAAHVAATEVTKNGFNLRYNSSQSTSTIAFWFAIGY